jgi:hypothetical protein
MAIDINVPGIGELLDEIRYFLIHTDNTLIGYNSSIAKDDSELSVSERRRITEIDAEYADLQKQMHDMNPDPATITKLSDDVSRFIAELVSLLIQQLNAQQELYKAITDANSTEQTSALSHLNLRV